MGGRGTSSCLCPPLPGKTCPRRRPRLPAQGPAPRRVTSARQPGEPLRRPPPPPGGDASTAEGRGATFLHPRRPRPVPQAADSARRGPRHAEPPRRARHGGERPAGREAGGARRAHTYRLLGSGRHGDGEQRPGPARLGGRRLPGGLPPPLGQPVPHVAGQSPPRRRPAQLPPPPPQPRRPGPAAGPQPPRRLRAGRGAQAAAPPQEGAQSGHGRRSAPATGGPSPRGCRQKPREKRRRGGEARGPSSPRPAPPAPPPPPPLPLAGLPARRRGSAARPPALAAHWRGCRHPLNGGGRRPRGGGRGARPSLGTGSSRQPQVLCRRRAAAKLVGVRGG